ncbi:unnamed protein product [Porites evermanni]|uniref:G-protein coupled receptors family 1 profile domain-containing protein n=1 Tax=Porites evermanni TaxID=104178 RepID=A0ABN8RLL7_9CNID|nr:unnamed protein product [Porites evermanni]
MANSTVDMMLDGLESDEESSPFETSVIIPNSVLNALLIPICITGNVLVLAAVWRNPSLRTPNPSLRTPSIILLCSLAVSDLFVGFLVLPVYVAIACFILSGSGFYSSLSQASLVLLTQLCCVSLETMTAISVDRYLALRYHMRYPDMMTSRRATCVAAIFWCKNVILSLLSIWKTNAILLVVVVFVALCLFISSITYSAIYRIVRHHQHQIHAQQQAQAVQSMNAEQNRKLQAKKRALNTFIYYICMLLCYFPSAVSILITVAYEPHLNISLYFDTIMFMNSAINPFLYIWRNREIRRGVLKILRKILYKTDEENLNNGDQ